MSTEQFAIEEQSGELSKSDLVEAKHKDCMENFRIKFPREAEKAQRYFLHGGYRFKVPDSKGRGGHDVFDPKYPKQCVMPANDPDGKGYKRVNGKILRCEHRIDPNDPNVQEKWIIHMREHADAYIYENRVRENLPDGRETWRPPSYYPHAQQTENFPYEWVVEGGEGQVPIRGDDLNSRIEKIERQMKEEELKEKEDKQKLVNKANKARKGAE